MVHVEALSGYHRSELKAIADLDRVKGQGIAKEYSCRFYESYEEMFRKEELDAVSVATPDFLHREPAIRAMDEGLDVLLEKPMATTVQDATAILSSAKKNGSKLMIDFHNRFSPPFVALKEAIVAGEMGKPAFIQARLNDTIFVPTKMLGWSGDSGVLWFLGSHIIDLSRWLLSSNPETAYCVEGRGVLEGMGIDAADYYQSLVSFESGTVASLENCWILPETHPSVYDLQLEFVGAEGSYNANASHTKMAEKFTRTKYSTPDVIASPIIHGRQMGFTKMSIWHFVDCVLDGVEPIATGEDGLWVTRTICSLLESAGTGEPVRI